MSFDQSNTRAPVGKGFADDLKDAVRENPIAAGLIGMGVLWMFFGGGKVAAFGGKLPGAARSAAGAIGAAAETGGSAIGEGLSAAGSQVADAARQVGDSIASGVQGASTLVRNTVVAGYDAITSEEVSNSARQSAHSVKRAAQTSARSGMEFGTSLQRNLSRILERQPLVLGAIGLAIGAGMASAFASTKVENDFMGEAGAATKEKMQEFASKTTEFATTRAKQVFDDVKNEAQAQGLAASAAKDAVKGLAEKARNVAGSTREAVKDRMSSKKQKSTRSPG